MAEPTKGQPIWLPLCICVLGGSIADFQRPGARRVLAHKLFAAQLLSGFAAIAPASGEAERATRLLEVVDAIHGRLNVDFEHPIARTTIAPSQPRGRPLVSRHSEQPGTRAAQCRRLSSVATANRRSVRAAVRPAAIVPWPPARPLRARFSVRYPASQPGRRSPLSSRSRARAQ